MGYLIAFLIGVLLLVGSLYLFSTSISFIKTGTRTLATVEELVQESGKKGKSTYRPIFRFTTITGKEIHYPYKVASAPPDWAVGEKATIVYKVDDPENPMVLTYFGAFGWAVIALAIAVALLIIGGGYFLFGYYAKQFLL
jgi:ABC-type antimicrobial peptide transport system permease subunit